MLQISARKAVGTTLATLALVGLSAQPLVQGVQTAWAETSASGDDAQEQNAQSGIATEKSETVKARTDASGAVSSVSVQTTLTNGNAEATLYDESNLSNIKADDEDTTFTQDGTALTWDAQGENVTYTGTSSDSLPLSLSVSYTLDGKEVSAEEIAGKSGRVTICYRFTNNATARSVGQGGSSTVHVPFVCASGVSLPADTFTNVSVDNGKTTTSDDSTTVIGFAMPGMAESLGVSGMDLGSVSIPESFTITADATNFQLGETVTYVSDDLLSDVDTDGLGLGNLTSELSSLQEGFNTIVEGSDSLAEALEALNSGNQSLDSSIATLQASMEGLPTATAQLETGANNVTKSIEDTIKSLEDIEKIAAQQENNLNGFSIAAASVDTAASDIDEDKAALDEQIEELTDLMNSTSDEATKTALQAQIEQLKQLSQSLGATSDELGQNNLLSAAESTEKVSEQLAELIGTQATETEAAAGLYLLSENAGALASGIGALNSSATTLNAGITQMKTASTQLASGSAAASEGSGELSEGLKTFNEQGIQAIVDALDGDLGGLSDNLNAMAQLARSYDNFSGITQGTEGSVVFVFQTAAIEAQN